MADVTITKGSKVEVSTDEPGFYGAWYEATILDIVPLSTKNRQKKKMGYLVKYDTLYAEGDLDEKLLETVDPVFVRPLQPKNDDVEFEVMDVVDCYHRDGWWCGVVIVVIESGDNVKKTYVVKLEDPVEDFVEVFKFEKTQMRLHFDWVDYCWKLAPKKFFKVYAGFDLGFWVLKYSGIHFALATPNTMELLIFFIKVSVMSLSNPNTPEQEVADKNATANLNSQSAVCQCSSKKKKHLRKKAVQESNSEMSGVMNGSVTTCRKRSTVNSAEEVSSSKKTRSSADVEKSDNQEARTTDFDIQPLSILYPGMQQKAVLKRSSCRNPCDNHDESSDALIPAAIVENSGSTEYHKTWPFLKRSPIRAVIESYELYLKTPQKPHFAPLKNVKEDCREALAIAHMVIFANVTQTISDLQLNDPINIIKNSLDTLAELETHGFNVGAMQARLNELRVWKVKMSQQEEKVKLFEKDLEKHNGEKPILGNKINELEEKIKELQEKMLENDDEINRLQSNKLHAMNQIKLWELAFEKLAASPF
ncbi:agenet-like domain, Agenet domain [Artemisia annua]|uniref:Agenet-like domain, Agenet domain n=1 Tax=Artemisia annua TaxID=35608 RepID=A0A2U1LZJ4_ARTAN|nr:agenet-like domain, Agenet domain [Artemisia annua]